MGYWWSHFKGGYADSPFNKPNQLPFIMKMSVIEQKTALQDNLEYLSSN